MLCEVYSSGLLGEGGSDMKDYYASQEQENADRGSGGGFAAQRMSGQMGTETHTGYVQQAEDQNPVENYEGEEETTQEKSVRLLHRGGWKRSEVTPKGNIIMTKADQPDAQIGTDGLINGKDYKLFLSNTGEQGDIAEDEQDDESLPQPEDTGVNSNQNRGSWGSAAFGNESEEGYDEDGEGYDEDIEMLVGKACPKDAGASDPTINPAALGGMVDIIAKAIADRDSEDEENTEDDDMLTRHHKKMADTDEVDQRYFKARDKQENAAARKQGFDPDENAEDGAAAAMRADERENKKRLRAQDAVAKIYGFNPDADEEDGAGAAMKADERENKRNLKAQDKKARKFGFDPDEDEYDEDEVDREKRYKERWGKDLDDERDREGSSSAGAYTDVDKDEFCGPSGGAADGTYPVNTRKRAIAAKSYAHNAPDPEGIDRCVARKWPDLDKDEDEEKKGKYDDGDGKDERCDHVPCHENGESYYSSKGDRAMTQLMESYEQVQKRPIENHNWY